MTHIPTAVMGYQGFGNVGDEAILTGIEEVLDGTNLDVTVIFCGEAFPVSAFPDARRVTLRRLRPSFHGIRALGGVRVLMMSGGGLLHDHWASVLPTYLAWSLLARILRIRVVWVGVGIGPLRSRRARKLTSWILRLAALVAVRDRASADLVEQVAPGVRAHVVPDPAVFNPVPVPRRTGGIGIIVRPPTPLDISQTLALAEALGGAAALWAGETGTPPTILTFGGPADDAFAEQVAELTLRYGSHRAAVERLGPSPQDALERLGSFGAIVSVRLHGFLLGTLLGGPSTAVAYDEKVASYAATIGASDLAVPLRQVSAERIHATLKVAQDPSVRAKIEQAVQELRSNKQVVAQLVTGQVAL